MQKAIPVESHVLSDASIQAVAPVVYIVESPPAATGHDAPPIEVAMSMSRDWRPIVAVAYGLLAVAALHFFAAGFSTVHHLVSALTVGPGPAGAFLSFLILVAIAAGAMWTLAGRQLAGLGTERRVKEHLLWIVGIALLALVPFTQHLTFGSPARYITAPVGVTAPKPVPAAPRVVAAGSRHAAQPLPRPMKARPHVRPVQHHRKAHAMPSVMTGMNMGARNG